METEKLSFASDYMEGAHPRVMERLVQTNPVKTTGYGLDPFCEEARKKIRAACACPGAAVQFLVGGTQANAVTLGALLRPYEGVAAAGSGHISVHEAGAVELGGHKVLALPQVNGKLMPQELRRYLEAFYADENHEHMVFPGVVYLSQPTEFGTLYSLQELRAIKELCRTYGLRLYVDGARLACALGCPENDVTLPELAMLSDAFYIGGTKCGALFGEAVVIPDQKSLPHFFTVVKQHGALLAKGRLLGVQFDALFTDGLYEQIGRTTVENAAILRRGLEQRGVRLLYGSPTNQLFAVLENGFMERLSRKVDFAFWKKYDEKRTVVRLATSWATTKRDVEELLDVWDEAGRR
ncbi:MAG: low specificity L-threonine aldolase [Oscillospiraceae bacterium]|nr:low specificity L-threonine aldolase [Oscillospiraceae bacterium]